MAAGRISVLDDDLGRRPGAKPARDALLAALVSVGSRRPRQVALGGAAEVQGRVDRTFDLDDRAEVDAAGPAEEEVGRAHAEAIAPEPRRVADAHNRPALRIGDAAGGVGGAEAAVALAETHLVGTARRMELE